MWGISVSLVPKKVEIDWQHKAIWFDFPNVRLSFESIDDLKHLINALEALYKEWEKEFKKEEK